MSTKQKKNTILFSIVILFVFPFFELVSPTKSTSPEYVVTLTAKDMSFNFFNPKIYVSPGERVKIILKNDDPGMKHNISLSKLKISSQIIQFGEKTILSFVAPRNGQFEYFCSMHPTLMRGLFIISEEKI